MLHYEIHNQIDSETGEPNGQVYVRSIWSSNGQIAMHSEGYGDKADAANLIEAHAGVDHYTDFTGSTPLRVSLYLVGDQDDKPVEHLPCPGDAAACDGETQPCEVTDK